jgi:hypothetical protein
MSLQAGAAVTDITPPLGSSLAGSFHDRKAEDVHDPLHAKALVLKSGGTALAVAILDVICCPRDILDQAKEEIAARCGIPAAHVLLACTHTHSGPATTGLLGVDAVPGYAGFLISRIVDAVTVAQRRLRPARVGWGAGQEPTLVFNRRFRMKDGSVRTNAGVLNAEIVASVGPTDPEVSVLAVETPEGAPIALLASYALHYVGGGSGGQLSADYFGFFAEALQRAKGTPFVAMLANGASGDINNIDVSRARRRDTFPFEHARRVAQVLAAEVLKVWARLTFVEECPLGGALGPLRCGVRQPAAAELAEAERIWEARGPNPREWSREIIYAGEARHLAAGPSEVETWVQALRIGDLGIAALSGEVFCRLGLDLKAAAPGRPTMLIELANDYSGYIPTRIAFEEGGYETWAARSSKLVSETGERMVATAVELLGGLFAAGG